MDHLAWTCALLASTLSFSTAPLLCQSNATGPLAPYSLSVAVNEVSLTFHVADLHGLPVNDLKREELALRDNGKLQTNLVAFQPLLNIPIRAGILIDTSPSMDGDLARNQATAVEYVQKVLRQQSDLAFVMDFDFLSKISQPWTSDPALLTQGLPGPLPMAGAASEEQPSSIHSTKPAVISSAPLQLLSVVTSSCCSRMVRTM